jgi:hypothetical protein
VKGVAKEKQHWTVLPCEDCGREIPGRIESALALALALGDTPVVCSECRKGRAISGTAVEMEGADGDPC